jgi:hypothetical protein
MACRKARPSQGVPEWARALAPICAAWLEAPGVRMRERPSAFTRQIILHYLSVPSICAAFLYLDTPTGAAPQHRERGITG